MSTRVITKEEFGSLPLQEIWPKFDAMQKKLAAEDKENEDAKDLKAKIEELEGDIEALEEKLEDREEASLSYVPFAGSSMNDLADWVDELAERFCVGRLASDAAEVSRLLRGRP
ncbi:MAG: hypothetical protein IT428_17530 [Planctomycetaceae bacterium]|nr:hypothetical protein [Planctomycetaceae bacterium]